MSDAVAIADETERARMNARAPGPGGGGRGSNLVMLLVLIALIGGLVFWAYQRNPPDTPSAAATAMPEAVPGGGNTVP